jgi:hypothetical protein
MGIYLRPNNLESANIDTLLAAGLDRQRHFFFLSAAPVLQGYAENDKTRPIYKTRAGKTGRLKFLELNRMASC